MSINFQRDRGGDACPKRLEIVTASMLASINWDAWVSRKAVGGKSPPATAIVGRGA
jgi:hypothetical protein